MDVMVQVGQIQRMSHLMPEHMSGEISRRTFKLEIEGVWLYSIDFDGIVDGVMREILHVRPQYGSPCSRATFNDKAHIVDITIVVTIKYHIVVNQMQGIHIMESTRQQFCFPPTNAHKRQFTLITDRIGRAIWFEIATRHAILIRNDLSVLNVIGVHRIIIDVTISHRVVEIGNTQIARSLSIEHGINGTE